VPELFAAVDLQMHRRRVARVEGEQAAGVEMAAHAGEIPPLVVRRHQSLEGMRAAQCGIEPLAEIVVAKIAEHPA
jgi:hypothetical protein